MPHKHKPQKEFLVLHFMTEIAFKVHQINNYCEKEKQNETE